MAELFNFSIPSGFTSTTIGSGQSLVEHATANINNEPGTRITINNTNPVYGELMLGTAIDPATISDVGLAFHCGNLLSLPMGAADSFGLVRGLTGTGGTRILFNLEEVSGNRRLTCGVSDDAPTILNMTPYVVTAEIDWLYLLIHRADSVSANNGWFELYADGVKIGEVLNIDLYNEFAYKTFRWGGINNLDADTLGILDWGPFIGRNDNTVIESPAISVPDAPAIVASAYSPEAITVVVTPGGDGGSVRTDRHFEYRETLVGGGWTRVSDGTGTTLTKYLRTLMPNTQYDVRVIDENAIGESASSNVATPTTPEQADPEALALLAFGQGMLVPPFFGDGEWSQEDVQQVLVLPRDPLLKDQLVEEDLSSVFIPFARVETLAGDRIRG